MASSSEARPGGENEDRIFAGGLREDRLLVGIVADGAGGSSGGGRAAVRAVSRARESLAHLSPEGALDAGPWRMTLDRIHGEIRRDRLAGMTTLTVFVTDGEQWMLAWVGDSRAYSNLQLPSGLVHFEPLMSGDRTGYLGGDSVRPQARSGRVRPGERFLLLSDGIWKYVRFESLKAHADESPRATLAALQSEVLRGFGGARPDDASGIILQAPRRT